MALWKFLVWVIYHQTIHAINSFICIEDSIEHDEISFWLLRRTPTHIWHFILFSSSFHAKLSDLLTSAKQHTNWRTLLFSFWTLELSDVKRFTRKCLIRLRHGRWPVFHLIQSTESGSVVDRNICVFSDHFSCRSIYHIPSNVVKFFQCRSSSRIIKIVPLTHKSHCIMPNKISISLQCQTMTNSRVSFSFSSIDQIL